MRVEKYRAFHDFPVSDRRSLRPRPPQRARFGPAAPLLRGAGRARFAVPRRGCAPAPGRARPGSRSRASRRGSHAPAGRRALDRERPPVLCSSPFIRDSDGEADDDRTRASPAGQSVQSLLRDGFPRCASPARAGRMRTRRWRRPVGRHRFRRPAHEFAHHRPLHRRGCRIPPAQPMGPLSPSPSPPAGPMRRAPVLSASARAAPSPGGGAPR